MKTTKEKQIVINVSEAAKSEIKAIKEQYDLTDKDFANIAIDMFKDSIDNGEIDEIIVAYAAKRKQLQLDEQLARYTRKIQMIRESMVAGETPVEQEQEDVVYSSATETEVDA